MLYPAKLSRLRARGVAFGLPANTEPTKRLKPTMSKKNGSSVSPAKKEAPVDGSAVIVNGLAVGLKVCTVVGAVKVEPLGSLIVAVCGVEREVCAENEISID